ncbi:hypothetical protein ACWDR1_33935 [Streptosporangium sandarakinum]
MTDNKAFKRAVRRLAERENLPYAEARRRIMAEDSAVSHQHPTPDVSALAGLPYTANRPVDLRLAAAIVGACRAGCWPCQDFLAHRLLEERATIAALAGAVYSLWPTAGPLASPATRAWHPLVRAARDSDGGTAVMAAIDRMSAKEVADLLDDALDHWALGGADVTPLLLDLDAAGEAESESRAADRPPSYRLFPGTVTTSYGPLPVLLLQPATADAGAEDLRGRCRWQPWDLTVVPGLDVTWRIRMDIATRSLREIVHVDAEGFDDLDLWVAAEPDRLPDDWWNLVDRAQQVLLCGPVDAGDHATPLDALTAALTAGELLAVLGRARFQ